MDDRFVIHHTTCPPASADDLRWPNDGPAPTPGTDSTLHALRLGVLLVEVGAGLLASYHDQLPGGEARSACVVALGPLREALRLLEAIPGPGLRLLGVFVEQE